MPRILIVSNRLPVTLDRTDGGLIYHPSAGGLATGLTSLDDSWERIWIGWPGQSNFHLAEEEEITHHLAKENLVPVFLSEEDVTNFYEGFCNKTIWPQFHYFPQYIAYNDDYWEAYKAVNQKFTDAVATQIRPDDIVWVHDYQLMLVPGMLRKQFAETSIGFFLHIPFPSYELFRTLPWREELLHGMLGADLIGFHTFGYMRHFLSSVYRLVGMEQNFGKLLVDNRTVNVDVFPMGINYEKYAEGAPTLPSAEVEFIRDYGKRRKLILSIDRLDYSKGIPQRVLAYERFLERNPVYHGKVTLIMVVVPSRANVDQYFQLKETIEQSVGRINGRFGTFNWIPIRYYYRSFPFDSLSAMYKSAHIALITPIRDGMNLVAKEFVASKHQEKQGVLILSEMAGAASDMPEALLINPIDINDMVHSLEMAMEMPAEEQKERLESMQERLIQYDIKYWARTFISQQMDTKKLLPEGEVKLLETDQWDELIEAYQTASSRLLMLDYDGTLVNFVNDPDDAYPDQELLDILKKLNEQPGTTIVIISGRDRHTLGNWFGELGIELVAEHGVWLWRNGRWVLSNEVNSSWKIDVRPIMDNLVARTPGSFVEEKDYTLAWHYRRVDKDLGAKRVREIRDGLIYLTANHNLQVLEGNKVVEIRNSGVHKGKAASMWINKTTSKFILAMGDDHTDEDTFQAMPRDAYTIKVGYAKTHAKHKLRSTEQARALLADLATSFS